MRVIAVVLPALLLAVCHSSLATTVALATSANVQWRGRYRQQLDGSASFDWEGVQFRAQVVGSTSVTALLSVPPLVSCRLQVFLNGSRSSTLFLNASSASAPVVLATGLAPDFTHEVNVYNALEPAIARGALFEGRSNSPLSNDKVPAPTLVSISVDGGFARPSTMRAIKIAAIGDGVVSGFGAVGPPCAGSPSDWSDHSLSFVQQLCTFFDAECLGTIAWTGKGLIANQPPFAALPTLPSNFYQTLGSEASARDWDFNRPSRPDVIIISLGAADLGGPNAGNATIVDAFVAAYFAFARNLTRTFYSGYPTLFLCAGPLAGAQVTGPVLRVISQLHDEANITAHFVNLTGVPLDGCRGYPGAAGHAEISARLERAISSTMGWKPAGMGQVGDITNNTVGSIHRGKSDVHKTACRATAWAAGLEPVVPAARPRPTFLPGLLHIREESFQRLEGDVVYRVRSDGTGDFASIQAALDYCNASAPGPPIGHVTLDILGRFVERVVISADFASGVSFIGNGSSPLDALLVFNQSNADNVS